MQLGFERRQNVLIVKIKGEIDHHTAEGIRQKIEQEFERTGCKHMIVDFSFVEFMDSSGIGMIIGRYKRVQAAGGRLLVAGAEGNIDRIFSVSGLYKIITGFPSVEAALLAAREGA